MENQNTSPTPEKKKLPTWAIVVITLAVVFIVLPVSCTACSAGCIGCAACAAAATDESDRQTIIDTVSGGDIGTARSDAGSLGDYYVEIQSARLGKDYEGNPVIFVTYSFTNNSEDAQSFMWTMSDAAFQDGVQLETALIFDDEQYDSSASMLEIKTGITITVESAYVLRNTTSPVEIEVTELVSLNDDMLTKTFEIAQ